MIIFNNEASSMKKVNRWSRRLTLRQAEVLDILAEFDCECWGQTYTHINWPGSLAFANFNRVADALVRRGLVVEGDRLEITELGREILNARAKEQL